MLLVENGLLSYARTFIAKYSPARTVCISRNCSIGLFVMETKFGAFFDLDLCLDKHTANIVFRIPVIILCIQQRLCIPRNVLVVIVEFWVLSCLFNKVSAELEVLLKPFGYTWKLYFIT